MKLFKNFSDWLSFKSERFPTVLLVLGYILLIGGCLASFSSCNSEKKATKYFNAHKPKAAKYCSETFPVKPETIIEYIAIDSAGYSQAYDELLTYADSILQSKRDTTYFHSNDTVYAYIKADTVKIRKDIEKKLKSALKPCIDSIVHIRERVLDSAKVFYLESQLKDREKQLGDAIADAKSKKKWRNIWMWIALAEAAWIFRGSLVTIIRKLITK